MKRQVWILQQCYGEEGLDKGVGAHPSKAAALDSLEAYVLDRWLEADPDDVPPDEQQECIDVFYEKHQDEESWSLSPRTVDFPDLPDDETILTSDECSTILIALGHIEYGQVADELPPRLNGREATPKEACNLIDSVVIKLRD